MIIELREKRGISERELAAGVNVAHSTLNNALQNHRKLDFYLVDRIANHLGVDVSHFSNFGSSITFEEGEGESQVSNKVYEILNSVVQKVQHEASLSANGVSLEAFLNWWYQHSGRLENFDRLATYVDLFSIPNTDAQTIAPIETGRSSLASICFDVQAPRQLQQTLDGFDKSLNHSLIAAHREAISKGEPVLSHPSLNVELRDGTPFKRQYRRILAPVSLPTGELMIANFSQDLSSVRAQP